jgi:hypothetical protein
LWIFIEANNFERLAAIVHGSRSMPTDISQDLHDARALLEQSGTEDEKRKYRKAAEIILLKTLRFEPENAEAKALLQSARAVPGSSAASLPSAQNEVPFSSDPVLFKSLELEKKKKKSVLKFPMGFGAILLIGGSLMWMMRSHPVSPIISAHPVERIERVKQVDFQPNFADSQPIIPVPGGTRSSASPLSAVPVDSNPKSAANVTVPPETITPKSTTPPAKPAAAEAPHTAPSQVPATGRLAVSSPAAADIFQNGQYLASTPTTLQLPAGQQTLEYRHGDLRSVVTHDIKPNEVTSASITFQITVQINSKPWAQVFLDGAPRRPLGQTPLSGVSVPIGGTLVFENSNFSAKTYRITEKDAAIQLNFP